MLSDTQILELLKTKKLSIINFNIQNLTPNGYDVTIAEIYIPILNLSENSKAVAIPPKTRFVINTHEYFKLSNSVVGELWIRTTWARKGIISSFGIVDAGFQGTLNLFAYNVSEKYVEIKVGERFAQIVFFELSTPAKKGYAKRSGTYQHQNTINIK